MPVTDDDDSGRGLIGYPLGAREAAGTPSAGTEDGNRRACMYLMTAAMT